MNTINKKEYQKKIVFFIDILGFKEMVEGTGKKTAQEIFDVMNTFVKDLIHNSDDLKKHSPDNSKQVTHFSDSVVISFDNNESSELFYTLSDIALIQIELFKKGVLLRGACAIGDLYHDEDHVFGPALNEAYQTERDRVKNPAIIISDDIIKKCSKCSMMRHTPKQEIKYIKKIVKPYMKKYHYIDYISYGSIAENFNDPNQGWKLYMLNIRPYIVNGLANNHNKEKYDWLREKYNNALNNIPNEYEYIDEMKELVIP